MAFYCLSLYLIVAILSSAFIWASLVLAKEADVNIAPGLMEDPARKWIERISQNQY
jgi:hypothetical protein